MRLIEDDEQAVEADAVELAGEAMAELMGGGDNCDTSIAEKGPLGKGRSMLGGGTRMRP